MSPTRCSIAVSRQQRTVIHHRRAGDKIETRVIVDGPIDMNPPGITITTEDIHES